MSYSVTPVICSVFIFVLHVYVKCDISEFWPIIDCFHGCEERIGVKSGVLDYKVSEDLSWKSMSYIYIHCIIYKTSWKKRAQLLLELINVDVNCSVEELRIKVESFGNTYRRFCDDEKYYAIYDVSMKPAIIDLTVTNPARARGNFQIRYTGIVALV